jgi:hypothetical protein
LKESEIQAFYRSLIRVVLENNAPRVLWKPQISQ